MHVFVSGYNTALCALKIYGMTQYIAFISCNLTKTKPIFLRFVHDESCNLVVSESVRYSLGGEFKV